MADVVNLFGESRYPRAAPLGVLGNAVLDTRGDHDMTVNEQLRSLQKDEKERVKDDLELKPADLLASYIETQFQSAKAYKESSGVQKELEESLMQYNDTYSAREMQLLGGSETAIWFPITSRLCDTMIAFFRQTLSDDVDHPLYDLESTKIPDPPEHVIEAAREAVALEVQQLIGQGIIVTPALIELISEELGETLKEEAETKVRENVRRAKCEVDDALEVSKWAEAFDAVLKDTVVLGTGIMEGPTPIIELKQYFDGSDLKTRHEKRPCVRALDPLRYFPSSDSTDPQNGSFQIYCDRLSQKELQLAVSCDGFIAKNIELLLHRRATEATSRDCAPGESQYNGQDKQSVNSKSRPWAMDTMVEVKRYYGCVPGKLLKGMGVDTFDGEAVEFEQLYEAEVYVAEGLTIRATCNRDMLNERPFSKAVLYDRPGTFWGVSAPKRIRDLQRMINTYFRSMARNAGFSSAPIFLIDHALIDKKIAGIINNVKPGMIIDQNSRQGLSGQAVQAIEISSRAAEFINAMAQLIEHAEMALGLPRFLLGGPAAGGAARTARGLAQLQSNAAVNIRSTIVNLDLGIVRPTIRRLHRWIVSTSDDDSLKGDVDVVTLGATSLLARETNKDQLIATLGFLMPFVQAEYITHEGVLCILRDIVTHLGLDARKVVANPNADARESAAMLQALQQTPGLGGGIATGQLSSGAQGLNQAVSPDNSGFNTLPSALPAGAPDLLQQAA